jgi:hypothetical protein
VINDWLRLTCTATNPTLTVGQSSDVTRGERRLHPMVRR